MKGCRALGIMIDEKKNDGVSGNESEIQDDPSTVKILVIPTDEELEIASHTVETIKAGRDRSDSAPGMTSASLAD